MHFLYPPLTHVVGESIRKIAAVLDECRDSGRPPDLSEVRRGTLQVDQLRVYLPLSTTSKIFEVNVLIHLAPD